MSNSNGKRKLLAKIMAWTLSALMVGSCGILLVSIIVELATK